MSRLRTVTAALPNEIDSHEGLAYSLWLPERAPGVRGGVLILHGAGSCKESHHDFARAVLPLGLGALAFDQRGHGASEGALDGAVLDDIEAMAALLRSRIGGPDAKLALRGSSMGGMLSILSAERVGANVVVAICPATIAGTRRLLNGGDLHFRVDVQAMESLLEGVDLSAAVSSLGAPLLLLHAEGDEQVPVQHSRELAAYMRAPGSRLIAVPGGHHRSIQHDEELQAVSLRFIERAFAGRLAGAGGPASA
jgi:uncharacterized protein